MRYRNKYGNKKIITQDGTFDSRKEYFRFKELSLLEKAGAIQELKRQVKYVLIPAQREPSKEVYKKGEKKGQPKPGRVIENECSYYADFVYELNGETVVEDTKGFKTKEYIIKRKLMLWIHGVSIREV